jgi:polysaccharide export outer membrane protein
MGISGRYGVRGRRGLGLLLVLVWAWLGTPSAAQVPTGRPVPPANPAEIPGSKPETQPADNVLPTLTPISDYVVGPQDIVTITVYGQNDLNGQFRIDGDGSFTFPLVGRVKASGLSVRQLENEITRVLKEFVKAPQVSVTVGQYKSRRLFIVGEVRNPGAYVLTGNMSLIEAIALAGSALQTASGEALIVRGGINAMAQAATIPSSGSGDKPDVQRVDLDALQRGNLDQNIPLQDGDTIFIPRAEVVFLVGHVKNPGAYPMRRGTTVLQALALAGGVTDRGASNRVDVERIENGTKVRVRVRLDELVRGGDTLIIPAKFF